MIARVQYVRVRRIKRSRRFVLPSSSSVARDTKKKKKRTEKPELFSTRVAEIPSGKINSLFHRERACRSVNVVTTARIYLGCFAITFGSRLARRARKWDGGSLPNRILGMRHYANGARVSATLSTIEKSSSPRGEERERSDPLLRSCLSAVPRRRNGKRRAPVGLAKNADPRAERSPRRTDPNYAERHRVRGHAEKLDRSQKTPTTDKPDVRDMLIRARGA